MRKNKRTNVIQMNDAKEKQLQPITRKANIQLIPRNTAQETYIDHLTNYDNIINIAIGPAGTGKSFLCTLHAINLLKNKEINRIVITRPAVSVDEQHGFLPGNLTEKMAPWTRPIFDIFEEYFSPKYINQLLEENVIEVAPLAFMRGRNFKNSYIIADEMQNATSEQMKMLLTRIGDNTYMTVTGDLKQHDRGYDQNGLLNFLSRLPVNDIPGVKISTFDKEHVERSPIVKTILHIYGED